MNINRRLQIIFDLIVLELLTIGLASFLFRGATSACDGFMHLSKVRIMLDTLKSCGYFPRWNPYWYFGVPMWRIYSPLSYYIAAFLGWIFNLSIFEIVIAWTYLVFSVASISMYFLASELDLQRAGRFASSILFLTSGNLILYWGNGSYPNVTSVAFSSLALFFFLKAVRKQSFTNILAAGLSFCIVFLMYIMNALILFFFLIVMSVILAIANPSLLYISKGISAPPKYTLILPKILFSMLLITVVLSSWWTLPFLKTYSEAPVIPEASSGIPEGDVISFLEQIFRIIGIRLNRYELPFSPGIGHIVLALIGCGFAFSKRKVRFAMVSLCFILSFVFNLAPWLGISTGFFFWWRFSLYLSLFAALCGGVAADFLKDFYEKFLDLDTFKFQTKRSVNRIYAISMVLLTLLVSVFPIIGSSEFIFYGYDLSNPPMPININLLESYVEPGERVGTDGSLSYGLNLFTKIPQSGGGNIHYVYMVNQFAYVFWRYMFVEKDGERLQYFARNYNVKWFIDSKMPGLTEVNPELPYEVENFKFSFVELLKPSNNLILYIGDENDYQRLFLSVAAFNPEDIILIYGGTALEGYDLTTLRDFDLIYLATFPHSNSLNISQLLEEYVNSGGCLILDTGNTKYGGESEDIPDPFPVEKTAISEDSHLILNPFQHNITTGIDFTKFSTDIPYTISYAKSIREGATILLYDLERPVLVYWNRGLGKVFWTGLRLPYLIMLNEQKMKNKGERPEGTKLLINLLRYAVQSKPSMSSLRFEQPCPEEIVVYVENASQEDAIWAKMTYYPGWTAWIEGENPIQLKIFKAGPNMMLVFPERNGDYVLRFFFDKTIDVKVGEFISMMGVIAILALSFYRITTRHFKKPKIIIFERRLKCSSTHKSEWVKVRH